MKYILLKYSFGFIKIKPKANMLRIFFLHIIYENDIYQLYSLFWIRQRITVQDTSSTTLCNNAKCQTFIFKQCLAMDEMVMI